MKFKTIIKRFAASMKHKTHHPQQHQNLNDNNHSSLSNQITPDLMDMPEEVLFRILSYLNKRDLNHAKVNHRMHQLIMDQNLQLNAKLPHLDISKFNITKTGRINGKVNGLAELDTNTLVFSSTSGIGIINLITGEIIKKKEISKYNVHDTFATQPYSRRY